ncbi:MAG: DUF484 family protein [Gammaproteobacteria bacterium]|nr:DUF484 family protein [Gammaproteobacteria bacterium]
MSTQQDISVSDKDFEREIVRYLRDHPAFFEQHLDLLADMILPHEHGGTVSLVERQVSVLRDQKDQYRKKLQTLINMAEKNEKLSHDFNSLILALLDAADLEKVLNIISERLRSDFEADAISLRLFNSNHPQLQQHPEIMDWSEPVLGAFEKVIEGRRPVCGGLKPQQLDALFAENASNIHSAALIPLVKSEHSKKCYGLLAIGSEDAQRFRADMGTLFLSHLGKVLSRVLKTHLGE